MLSLFNFYSLSSIQTHTHTIKRHMTHNKLPNGWLILDTRTYPCRTTKTHKITNFQLRSYDLQFYMALPTPTITTTCLLSLFHSQSRNRHIRHSHLAQEKELAAIETRHVSKMSTTNTKKIRVPTNIRPHFIKPIRGLTVERKCSSQFSPILSTFSVLSPVTER